MEKFIPLNIAKSDPTQNQFRKGFKPQSVILLACPWVFQNEVEFQSQQLGLAYIGSYIEECGHSIAAYIDPMLDSGYLTREAMPTQHQTIYRVGKSDEAIIESIGQHKADWIFINAPFTDSRFVCYRLINKIKSKFPNKTIVVGGILATTLSTQIFDHTSTDIVVKGEGEIAAARILNGEKLDTINGVIFKDKNGKVFANPSRSEQLEDINRIPWITKHKFRPMDKYVQWSPRGNQMDRTFSYISSRGCPFTCEFCSIPEKGQRWRSFDPQRVIDECKYMVENHGVNHFEFEDDNFTLKSSHSLAILGWFKEMRDKGYDISISFPNGIMIDRLDKEQIFALRDAGTDIVYLPVEAGNLQCLISMDKPVALEHLHKTIEVAELTVEAGLNVSCFFIVGYPGGKVSKPALKKVVYEQFSDAILLEEGPNLWIKGEDERCFEETCKFATKLKEIGVRNISPLIATPYPGTNLYEVCEKFGWLREKDHAEMITTISYQNPKEEFVNISTPWCSYKEAFRRWKVMSAINNTRHNVIKK